MSALRRLAGGVVICLMAGWGAQPSVAAEPTAVSRAVEVTPPQDWTPDTPLFGPDAQFHEGAPRGRTPVLAAPAAQAKAEPPRQRVKAAQKAGRPGVRVARGTRGPAPKQRARASLAERRVAPLAARQAASAVADKPPRTRQPVATQGKARVKIRTKARAKPAGRPDAKKKG